MEEVISSLSRLESGFAKFLLQWFKSASERRSCRSGAVVETTFATLSSSRVLPKVLLPLQLLQEGMSTRVLYVRTGWQIVKEKAFPLTASAPCNSRGKASTRALETYVEELDIPEWDFDHWRKSIQSDGIKESCRGDGIELDQRRAAGGRGCDIQCNWRLGFQVAVGPGIERTSMCLGFRYQLQPTRAKYA